MLLPDHIYRRIPLLWMLMGFLFLLFGLMAGPDFRFFSAYILLGFVCLGRSIWLYQARQRVARHSEVDVLTQTQKMDRKLR
jgi:hypothetical protein